MRVGRSGQTVLCFAPSKLLNLVCEADGRPWCRLRSTANLLSPAWPAVMWKASTPRSWS